MSKIPRKTATGQIEEDRYHTLLRHDFRLRSKFQGSRLSRSWREVGERYATFAETGSPAQGFRFAHAEAKKRRFEDRSTARKVCCALGEWFCSSDEWGKEGVVGASWVR